ncbi:MAG: hypothetical protein RH859_02055 [Longimicrobiales bacterium]
MNGQDSWRSRLALRALGTLVGVECLLMVPAWVLTGQPGPRWFALEGGILVALFALLPRRRWTAWAAALAGASVTVVSVLLVADAAARMSLARPLNLYLDVRLVGSVRNLLDGTLGPGLGLLVLVGIVLAAALGAGAVGVGLASLRTPDTGWRPRVPALAGLAVFLLLIPLRWLHPAGVALALPVVDLGVEQQAQWARMLGERERFSMEMAVAPARLADTPGLLEGLDGRDVVVAFVESYGVSALEDPRYAPVVRPALERLALGAGERGLHVASGLLLAPSQGGMSWLGHGTFLSGLWLDNQLRYDLLLASDRPTLVDDFEAAGYRTAALVPQITLAWPEGARLGYDRVWSRPDIDYRGPPLNWVEIPDQFTWAFLDRVIREADRSRPLFAELSLISSHAPWTPVLELEPWSAVGDGSVFERWRDAGETPEELWRDHDRVREAFARSLHYALDVAADYVAERLPASTVLILLGDHQPAPMITGDDASRAVPVHVIAADSSLVAAFAGLGFVPGAVPPAVADLPTIPRMSVVRAWLVRTFSAGPAATDE